ncbi:MAG: helix-turn-helix transcriptional regulator [Treponema sp.]|nr:helix-turn-helix transcriptional regulator [Treponema sp.]
MEGNRTFIRPVIDLQATGSKIKELRKRSSYSIKDMQQMFGFDFPQAIYAWEQGRNVPTVDNLMILARMFNVSIEDIICVRNVEVCISDKKQCEENPCENCRLKTA